MGAQKIGKKIKRVVMPGSQGKLKPYEWSMENYSAVFELSY